MEYGEILIRINNGYLDKVAKSGIHPSFSIKKRRTAADRLKSRMYYRRNKNKIKVWRKKYNQKRKMLHASRKMLHRPSPNWLHKALTHKPKKPHHVNPFHHLFKAPKHMGLKKTRSHGTHTFKIHKPKSLTLYKPRRRELVHR